VRLLLEAFKWHAFTAVNILGLIFLFKSLEIMNGWEKGVWLVYTLLMFVTLQTVNILFYINIELP